MSRAILSATMLSSRSEIHVTQPPLSECGNSLYVATRQYEVFEEGPKRVINFAKANTNYLSGMTAFLHRDNRSLLNLSAELRGFPLGNLQSPSNKSIINRVSSMPFLARLTMLLAVLFSQKFSRSFARRSMTEAIKSSMIQPRVGCSIPDHTTYLCTET